MIEAVPGARDGGTRAQARLLEDAVDVVLDRPHELISMFAEDAVYVEPFSGAEHIGRDSIRAWLGESWQDQPPGIRITVEQVDVVEEVVEVRWACEADALSRPTRGRDRFTIRDGQIARLETELLEPPEAR